MFDLKSTAHYSTPHHLHYSAVQPYTRTDVHSSRGLGDVYKRQAWSNAYSEISPEVHCDLSQLLARKITKRIHSSKPASPNRPTPVFVSVSVFTRVSLSFCLYLCLYLCLSQCLSIPVSIPMSV